MRTVLAFVHACTDKLSEKISNKECKWSCCFLNENRQGLFLEKKKKKKEIIIEENKIAESDE